MNTKKEIKTEGKEEITTEIKDEKRRTKGRKDERLKE